MPWLKEFWGRVVLAFSFLLLAKIANVGVPVVLKDIVDQLDADYGRELTLPLALLLVYGVLRLSSALFNELRDGIFAKVRYRAMRRIAVKVFSHLHELSLKFHLDRRTGGISRDIERGTQSVSTLLNLLIFNIIPTLFEFVLVALLLLSSYPIEFALVTFLTVLVYVTFTWLVTEWRVKYRYAMNALDSDAGNQSIDSLINYETVKYFNNEAHEAALYDQTLSQWESAAVKSQTSMSALNFGQSAIIGVGVTLLMVYASRGVVDGTLTLGDLVLVNTLMLQLFIPLGFLGMVYRQIKHNLVDMESLFDLMDKPSEVADIPHAPALRVEGGHVRFDDVNFSYTPERAILNRVSFDIPAGHKVAVIGPSGAGKSTLARLLFRFYDTDSGCITIDGQAIDQVSQASLRENIGIVPQDTVLFNESLYYNIAYARVGASDAEVRRAAKLANMDAFIQSLPDGYNTLVGERGLKLSGGEKQRIAIARVILKNPRILVFDEATSSLDSQTEKTILQSLRDLSHQHSTLVIAHRLSTVIDADEILVLDQKGIVARGTHKSLLSEQGLYADLWSLQQK